MSAKVESVLRRSDFFPCILQDGRVTHREGTDHEVGRAPPTSLLPDQADPQGSGRLLEHLGINTDVSFAALVAFATVDEFGHFGRAARFLGRQQQGLRQHVKNLEEALHTRLLGTGPDGAYHAVGPIGCELRDRARLMVFQYGAIGRLTDDAVHVHYLPQHGFFMAAVEARLNGVIDLRPTVLGDEHRSSARFHDDVIVPLAGGTIDIGIGMPPPPDSPPAELLASIYLYSFRQEAMIPVGDPRDRVLLSELVAERAMLVPPMGVRSREQLEQEIARDVPDDPGPGVRVRREAFGTKVLIQYGMRGLGTVVVPSSIAYPFYAGNDYGGPASVDYKWVPVCTSADRPLYQGIYAIVRRARDRRSEQITRVVNLVRQEVAELGLEQDTQRERSP